MPSAGTTEHLRQKQQLPVIEPIAMRVPDACRFVGVSRSTLYLLIAKGEVEIIKLGSSTLVLTASLRQLVAGRRHGSIKQDQTD